MARRTKNPRFTRRSALQGLGAAAALAPFLPVLDREVKADTGGYPTRLILLFSANGSLRERWSPIGTEADFSLSQLEEGPEGPQEVHLLSPLSAYKDKLILLDGLQVVHNGPGDPHQQGMGRLWTGSPLLESDQFGGGDGVTSAGWASHISIDQEIANAVGNDSVFKSLEFAVQPGGASVWTRMCYAGSNQPIAPEDDPAAMFERLFSAAGLDTGEIERLRAERRSVIDLVKTQLDSVGKRLGGEDRMKYQAHLEAIREVERRNELEAPACSAPDHSLGLDHTKNDNFPEVTRQMIDQMVAALSCDLTRVASLQWSQSFSETRFTWLGQTEAHHDISHYGDNDSRMTEWITEINIWYAEQVAYLLAALDAVPEGEGTLLDHSIVVWGNELARGNVHSNQPVPFVIAGGGGGALRTGRFHSYYETEHNRLLVSLAQAMGHPIDAFGTDDQGGGGLDELFV